MSNPTVAARPRELALVALGLAVLAIALLSLGDGAILLTHPMWVDEWFTVMVASRPSAVDVVADLARGADGGASLFHLSVWALEKVAGGATPVAVRIMSLACVLGACWLVYAVLRTRFGCDASAAGVLAVASNAIVATNTFEGRFYAPWTLCCALFAWSINRRAIVPSRYGGAVLAIASVLLCTVHWYGAITMGLMTCAVVASHGRDWRTALRIAAPTLAGMLAVVAIAPLALGQNRAISVNSWVADFTPRQLTNLLDAFWFGAVPLGATLAIGVGLAMGWFRDRGRATAALAKTAVTTPGVAALSALALLPLALAALSVLGQPSMLARYALPTILAWATLVAFAAEIVGRWPARVAAALFVLLWYESLVAESARWRAFASGIQRGATDYRAAVRHDLPIVFTTLHLMYPMAGRERGEPSLALYLDLPDSTMDALFPRTSRLYQRSKGFRLERDFARVHQSRYRFPALIPPAMLDSMERFLLYVPDSYVPAGVGNVTAFGALVFPHHQVRRLNESVSLVERKAARSLRERNTSR